MLIKKLYFYDENLENRDILSKLVFKHFEIFPHAKGLAQAILNLWSGSFWWCFFTSIAFFCSGNA